MPQHKKKPNDQEMLIAIVGPCAAGKSTLIDHLRNHGYQARHVAQEHSYVPDMWRRIAKPDILIFLDVTYPVSMQRKRLNWNEQEFEKQAARLEHARRHADLYIDTNDLDASSVQRMVLKFLDDSG